ncbi:MAG: AMP-dependent synthetase [Hyphomicrobiales bacterium]|nr:MAG: AMP-dependent synthetase [Hyphomicrobiales bacterium]
MLPSHFNLAEYVLARSASEHPEKAALLVYSEPAAAPEVTFTFAEIEDAVLRIATGLVERGVERGDRLLLRLGNTPEFPLVFFGAIAAGCVPVPTSAQLTSGECDKLLIDSGARLVVHDDHTPLPAERAGVGRLGSEGIAALHKAARGSYADTAADDPAFLVYTSGTSGKPKGVLHAQRSAFGRRPMYRGWYGIGPDDVLLHAGAFNWTYTLGVGLTDPWANGATSIVYTGHRDPDVWPSLLESTGATLFAAVPSLYRRILKYGHIGSHSFPSLRHGLTAGEALRPSMHAEWLEKTGRPLYEALGMSEISTYISSGPETPTRPGSPGRPQPGRNVAILSEEADGTVLGPDEPGLLCVHRSDPGLMLGYWQDEAGTDEAFLGEWFRTGDRARIDADGYVWYEGRADDVMNAFGYRVAPEEVEAALAGHPLVHDVAVTETEVRDGIRLITAFVVPNGDEHPNEGELNDWCHARLAEYKRPRRWVFVHDLPRTPSGKVQRRELAKKVPPHSH